jgi:DNA-binding NtrC family response regulator
MKSDEGFICLKKILKAATLTKVIIVRGKSDREKVLRTFQPRDCDVPRKPIDLNELKVILL